MLCCVVLRLSVCKKQNRFVVVVSIWVHSYQVCISIGHIVMVIVALVIIVPRYVYKVYVVRVTDLCVLNKVNAGCITVRYRNMYAVQ